jgi:hypothetical protein
MWRFFYGDVAGQIDMAFAYMATVLLFVRDGQHKSSCPDLLATRGSST